MSQTLQNVHEQIKLLSPDEMEQRRRRLSLEKLHIFDTEPLSGAEKQRVLVQAGSRAGWDDPGMDVYDSLDPRRAS
jgi:hypothetical protein